MIGLGANYPAGAAGLGLVLLRISAATLLVTTCNSATNMGWVVGGSFVISGAILAGAFTRTAALLSAGFGLSQILTRHDAILDITLAAHVIDALALALLGGGAYSIDFKLFGRRVIEL